MNIADDDDSLLLGPLQIQCGMNDRRERKPCTGRSSSDEEAMQVLNYPIMACSSKRTQRIKALCSRVLAKGS